MPWQGARGRDMEKYDLICDDILKDNDSRLTD